MVNGKFAQLTRKHGIKVGAGFLCSVEHGVVEMGLTVCAGIAADAASYNNYFIQCPSCLY